MWALDEKALLSPAFPAVSKGILMGVDGCVGNLQKLKMIGKPRRYRYIANFGTAEYDWFTSIGQLFCERDVGDNDFPELLMMCWRRAFHRSDVARDACQIMT